MTYLIHRQSANVTFVSSVISLGCSYVLFVLSIFIFSPVSLLLMHLIDNETILYDISFSMVGVLQMILSIIPFRFRRLKSGMPFLKQQASSDVGIFVSISLLLAISFFCISTDYHLSLLIPLIFITLSGIIIFFWWKSKLTESYIRKIKERKIDELHEEIEELKQYNAILSKIIHKDNKLIPAMELTVKTALSEIGDNANEEERQKLSSLLSQLEHLSKERKGIMQINDSKAKSVYVTGSPAIDTVLKYFSAKAYSEQINFDVIVSERLQTIIPEVISEEDFRTLVADLIENAFISVKKQTARNVLLHLRMENNIYYVEFYDSGHCFAKEVLDNLGKNPITTHINDGGSGIGYMSTCAILERCHATLNIDENLSAESYTKKVSLLFSIESI